MYQRGVKPFQYPADGVPELYLVIRIVYTAKAWNVLLIPIFWCVHCRASMAAQLQVVVHGGLPPIMSMAASHDPDDQRHAAMALGNIASNEGNHPQLVARGAIQTLVALSASQEADVCEFAGFALANLASNADYLDAIGAKGGIAPLVKLAGSANVQTQVRLG